MDKLGMIILHFVNSYIGIMLGILILIDLVIVVVSIRDCDKSFICNTLLKISGIVGLAILLLELLYVYQ